MRSEIKLLLFFFTLILFGSILIFYVAISAFSYNPFSLPHIKQIGIITLFPEGFGFFTKDPREPIIRTYKVEHDMLVPLIERYSSPSNFFGIKRTSKAKSVQLGSSLGKQIKKDDWIEYSDDLNKLLYVDTIAPIICALSSTAPMLCGDIWLQKIEPIPWAWSKSGNNLIMPSKIVRLYVKCNE